MQRPEAEVAVVVVVPLLAQLAALISQERMAGPSFHLPKTWVVHNRLLGMKIFGSSISALLMAVVVAVFAFTTFGLLLANGR
jgi:hypothetical protein